MTSSIEFFFELLASAIMSLCVLLTLIILVPTNEISSSIHFILYRRH